MALLRSVASCTLRTNSTATPALRTTLPGPSIPSISLLCRSFASTSIAVADKPSSSSKSAASSAASTYTAILDSLTDSYEKTRSSSTSRLSRPSDGRRGYVEDLEAEWASRAVYGESSWPATPFSGRSIRVTPQADPQRAYGQLSVLLRRNNVRQELRLQQRYEKPNEERRRKKSERHRRRFADMVRRKVQLVMAIKARGA